MNLVSVIVPIYKVEAYLDRCVESIVNQTYQNLEIILVDDGSPDRCPQMCDEWAKKDSRIRVIHKKNGGLSDARNAGMDIAAGDYIAFIDSDDWVDKEYIAFLYRSVAETDAPLSACAVRFVYNDVPALIDPQCLPELYTAEQALATLQKGIGFRAVAWNKLYKKSLLQGERFEVGKYHEDEFFTYRILAKAGKAAFVDVPLYNYLQREGSIMASFSMRRLDTLDAALLRMELFRTDFPALYPLDKSTFCISCANFYIAASCKKTSELPAMRAKIKHCRKQVHYSFSEFLRLRPRDMTYVLGTAWALRPFCWLLRKQRKE